jgi:hypothetical protein
MTEAGIGASKAMIPEGPWVMMTGMHRSGTSAVAGLLGALGFQTPDPDDRMDWPESNPEHWESMSLTVFDDDLLARLGGSWDAPPDLAEGWEGALDMRQEPDPTALLSGAFPQPGPLMWKDPRICLLYPYWRQLLPVPAAVVLVWRSPSAVADSLFRRDGMDHVVGVALWERYNRAALANLRGLDCFIVNYEELLGEPRAIIGTLADWLASLERFGDLAGRWDLEDAVTSLTGESQPTTGTGPSVLLPEQLQLADHLSAAAGGHRPLDPGDLGEESPWTTGLLRSRRQYRSRELDAVRTALGDEIDRRQASADYWKQAVTSMVDSTSWRVTRPLRAAVARAQRAGQTPVGPGAPSDGGPGPAS